MVGASAPGPAWRHVWGRDVDAAACKRRRLRPRRARRRRSGRQAGGAGEQGEGEGEGADAVRLGRAEGGNLPRRAGTSRCRLAGSSAHVDGKGARGLEEEGWEGERQRQVRCRGLATHFFVEKQRGVQQGSSCSS